MSEAELRKQIHELQATVGMLTSLVYDATTRSEVLMVFLLDQGVPADRLARVLQMVRADYADRLQHASQDLRIQAILKYIEDDKVSSQ